MKTALLAALLTLTSCDASASAADDGDTRKAYGDTPKTYDIAELYALARDKCSGAVIMEVLGTPSPIVCCYLPEGVQGFLACLGATGRFYTQGYGLPVFDEISDTRWCPCETHGPDLMSDAQAMR